MAYPFDEEKNNRLRGIGRLASLEIILESYEGNPSEETKRTWADRKNTYYRRYLEQMSPRDLGPEVKSTLDLLRARGLKEAVGSSSKNAKVILKRLGLEHYFDAVSDGTDITRSKPDPEVYLKAAEYLGIAPGYCLVVEDAKSGIEAALSAHMDCAAVGDGTTYRLATYDLTAISDLLTVVDN